MAGTGWGEVRNSETAASVRILGGTVRLSRVSLPAGKITDVRANGGPVAWDTGSGRHEALLAEPLSLPDGAELTITIGRKSQH